VIFSLLQEGIQRLDKNSTISIHTALADHAIRVRITLAGETAHEQDDFLLLPPKALNGMMERIGGNIVREQGKEMSVILPL
jgi:hypothetical protein